MRRGRPTAGALLLVALVVGCAVAALHAMTATSADAAPTVPTTTSLTSSASPSVAGQAVVLRATVSGTSSTGGPVGPVTFTDGTRMLGTAGWWFGSYSISVSDLTPGTHTITATYSADTTFMASSASITQTVTSAATTLALTSSANPAVAGDGVTLKAQVTLVAPGGGFPRASVVFSEGTTALGTVSPYYGSYGLLLPQLPAGAHVITASYVGDEWTRPSAASLTQTILVRPTTMSVRSSLDPSLSGSPATLTATVAATSSAAGQPSGVISFREGTTVLGTGTWWFGSYSLRLPDLPPGDHVITTSYPGSSTFGASSASLTQHVRMPTVSDASASPSPATTTDAVSVTATVRPNAAGSATPTGTVTVGEGTTTLATGTLSQGRAVTALPPLSAGDHQLVVRYGGDGINAGSSISVPLVVRIASTVTVVASQNPSVPGQPVTFTATVGPRPAGAPVPTGSVTVVGGLNDYGTAALVDGTAAVTLPALASGDHVLTVSYTGDGAFRAATATIAHVVGTPTASTIEPAPLVVTQQPTSWQSLGADPASPAAKHFGDGGNQIRLPSDGNILWASSDVSGVDSAGVPFLVNNVLSISSPANPLVQRQPLSPSGVPYQAVNSSWKGTCTATGSTRVLWNGGMVAIPQAGWDQVLIWFQAYCLGTDGSFTAQSVGVAEFDYTPALANDMVTPWASHIRILSEDLYGSQIGVEQPELGPDGNIYLYRCYTNGTQPLPQDLLGCKVARVAPVDAADSTRYRYWDGTGWGATSQDAASYMVIDDVVSPGRMPAGMFKVTYIAQANLWVLGSQAWPGYNGTPLFRVARSPQGPWSIPATIPYVGCGGTTGHTCYGSMVSAALSSATQLTVVFFDNHGQAPPGYTGDLTNVGGQLHVVTAAITMPSPTSNAGPVPLAPTATSVTTPTNPSTGGQAVKLTATVASTATGMNAAGVIETRTPGGTVTFKEGTTVYGTATNFYGTYGLVLPVLSAGTHTITASFSGDDVFAPSSTSITLTVVLAQTTMALASSANPSTINKPATLKATLSVVAPGAGVPSGSVTFREGSTVLGTANVFYGAYNFVLPNLAAGDHLITASYAGDATYGPSSVTITQQVLRITTTVTITSSASSAPVGTDVKFSATVTGGPWTSPTGTVTFREGSTVLGTGTWWFGSYNLTLRTLSAGTHTITAQYSGDASFLPGSASLIQVVTA